MNRLILIAILFILSSPPLHAQAPQWIVYNTGNSGLPTNAVQNIATEKTSTGNVIWIAAGKSLVKYNGTNWFVYDSTNSLLPNFTIWALEIDEMGNKWIGTSGGGLVKFDNVQWTIYTTQNSGLTQNSIFSLAFEGNSIWIGTVSLGLTKFNGANWINYRTSNSGIPSNNIYSIAIENNIKWVGTYSKGVGEFNDTVWTTYNSTNSSLPWNEIREIKIDTSGNKWIGIRFGWLAKLRNNNWTIYNYTNSGIPPNTSIEGIVIDSAQNKWIAISGASGGMLKFDDSSWSVYTPSNSPIPSDFCYNIAIDSNNNKWIGTTQGLAVYNENGIVSVNNISNELPTDFNLFQNYPNPFNPTTTINYQLSKASDVKIIIYDITGRTVQTIVDNRHSIGNYSITFDAFGLSSGVYFYKLETQNYTQTKKMLLLK